MKRKVRLHASMYLLQDGESSVKKQFFLPNTRLWTAAQLLINRIFGLLTFTYLISIVEDLRHRQDVDCLFVFHVLPGKLSMSSPS